MRPQHTPTAQSTPPRPQERTPQTRHSSAPHRAPAKRRAARSGAAARHASSSRRSAAEDPVEKQHQSFFGRLFLVTVVLCLAFSGLAYRAYDLQVQRSEKFRKMIQASQVATLRLSARRGTVFDRNMAPLALSVDVDSLGINPRQFRRRHKLTKRKRRQLARRLSVILKKPLPSVQRVLEQDSFFAWLKRHISPQEMQAVKQLGINFALRPSQEPRRFYPNHALASHILGHTDIDGRGLAGVERTFDRLLRGKPQVLRLQHDTKGRHILINPKMMSRRGSPGANLLLTLDKTIQFHTERELAKAVTKFEAKRGIAIVMNPNNGDVLGLAVYPTFDPNKFHKTKPSVRSNWAVTAPYEPGSTLKALTLAIARDLRVARLTERMDCENGRMRIGRYTIRDDHPKKYPLTPQEVLQFSSNICTAKLAFRIGKKRLYQYFRNFGLGQRTNIGLPGESKGIFHHYKRWAKISLANIAFGQGVAVTPLQLVTAISAIANGGLLMQPRLYKAVTNADGQTIKTFPNRVVRRVLSERAARETRKMMAAVVTKGTGTNAAIDGMTSAGKTGTAQKPATGRRGYGKGRIGSFVGFVPADKPKLAILVVIDEPKKSKYGGTVAAPAWKQIAVSSLQYLGDIPSTGDPVDISQFAQPPVAPKLNADPKKQPGASKDASKKPSAKPAKPGRPPTPSFLGLEWSKAHHKAQRLGLKLKTLGTNGRGYVRYQRPPAGVPLRNRKEITVIFR